MGTAAWDNLRAFGDGDDLRERMYASVYGDSLTGDLAAGPFVIGPFTQFERADPMVRVLLRTDLYLEPPNLVVDGVLAQTDARDYHGGDITEEIAALISLALRTRARTGGRWWSHGLQNDDLSGVPFSHDFPAPSSPLHPRGLEVLPGVQGPRDVIDAAEYLDAYGKLSARKATALMKAARQYQLGIWVANEDPNLAWLRLVSAVEAAAQTLTLPRQTHLERVRDLLPDLAQELLRVEPERAEAIAKSVSGIVGSTRKFSFFFERFCPPPPVTRPEHYDQVDWDTVSDALGLIYSYRSKALHEGRPFPAPMCESPRLFGAEVGAERPGGLSSSAYNASWMADECPMLLSTFEYIVHGALMAWWSSL